MQIKNFFRLREVAAELDLLFEQGLTKGNYLGFENLHEIYSFKAKGTTYVYGSPFSGKTEWWFEIMMNLTSLYGYRHAIYSPESGDAKEIFAELLSKYIQKPFYKNLNGHLTQSELLQEKDFVDEYFYIIDPQDRDLTIEEFFSTVNQLEKQYGIKINTTCCDPFNELKHNFDDDEGRQDLYIENRLGYIRRDAFANSRHNVIVTHVRDQEQIKTKDGIRYFPPASPRELAGGQAWYRKAMNMISVWRPPFGLTDEETGAPYEENEVHIIVKKYKPKGVGKLGKVKLYFDNHKNRYYEMFDGKKRYAGKQTANPYQTKIDDRPF